MENLTNWCVYMHEHRESGKKYVGITSQKPTNRWQNGKHYSGNAYFYAAIQKYGWDAFRHEILYTCLTREEAERLEIELIAKYQTQDPAKGYNLAAGGATNSGWHHTAESKEKIGARTRGVSLTDEHKARIGAAQRGEKNHAFGKSLSEVHKHKISEKLTGHAVSDETRQKIQTAKTDKTARKVICISTGEVFISVAEAARQTGVSRSGIIQCCRKQRPKAGGFCWAYAEAVGVT